MASNRTDRSAEAPADKPGPKRSRIGRRTVRTDETRAALEEAIGDYGLTDRSACEYAGIHPDTFYEWLKADAAFSDGIQRARAKFKALRIRQILAAAPTDWRAAAWIMSHRFASEYAERQQIALEAQDSPLDRLFHNGDENAAPEP